MDTGFTPARPPQLQSRGYPARVRACAGAADCVHAYIHAYLRRSSSNRNDDHMLNPTGYFPTTTLLPTWPTAYTAHSQHCGHTALSPG